MDPFLTRVLIAAFATARGDRWPVLIGEVAKCGMKRLRARLGSISQAVQASLRRPLPNIQISVEVERSQPQSRDLKRISPHLTTAEEIDRFVDEAIASLQVTRVDAEECADWGDGKPSRGFLSRVPHPLYRKTGAEGHEREQLGGCGKRRKLRRSDTLGQLRRHGATGADGVRLGIGAREQRGRGGRRVGTAGTNGRLGLFVHVAKRVRREDEGPPEAPPGERETPSWPTRPASSSHSALRLDVEVFPAGLSFEPTTVLQRELL